MRVRPTNIPVIAKSAVKASITASVVTLENFVTKLNIETAAKLIIKRKRMCLKKDPDKPVFPWLRRSLTRLSRSVMLLQKEKNSREATAKTEKLPKRKRGSHGSPYKNAKNRFFEEINVHKKTKTTNAQVKKRCLTIRTSATYQSPPEGPKSFRNESTRERGFVAVLI